MNQNDPTEFFNSYFKYKELPKKHVDLGIFALVGSMGSGKTNVINLICNILYKIYSNRLCIIKTNDLISAVKGINNKYFVYFLIFDDAMKEGIDSRRALSRDNVIMSQKLSIVRHLARENLKAGILFICFSIQDRNRLDPFIRRNLDFIIYKNYYDELKRELSVEDRKYMMEFTDRALLKHDFKSRGYSLLIDRVGRKYKYYFPLAELNKEIKLRTIEKDDKNEDIKNVLGGKMEYVIILLDKLINKKTYDDLAIDYEIPRTTIYRNCKEIELLFKTQMEG